MPQFTMAIDEKIFGVTENLFLKEATTFTSGYKPQNLLIPKTCETVKIGQLRKCHNLDL